jgi:hypothetical protein
MTIIGLYSTAPQSGKSTVAQVISDEIAAEVLPMAGPLKAVVHSFLEAAWIDWRNLRKEDVVEPFGVTLRSLYQTLGTEWGRECVHPDVWLHVWKRQASGRVLDGTPVVVDDVRFPNEARLIKNMGGVMWRVTRPGQPRPNGHVSEGGLDGWDFDGEICNDGSIEDLIRTVHRYIKEAHLC